MDLQRKIEIANRAIESISRHFDESPEQVRAALVAVSTKLEHEHDEHDAHRAEHEQRVAADKAEAAARRAEHDRQAKGEQGESEVITRDDVATLDAGNFQQ